jgi:RNA polymerase sigma-70 factor (ECF subfamily)
VIGADELFRAHAAFVASLVHRLGVPRSDVPDLVQEVFLLTHEKGGFEPRGVAKPRTWVAAIAVRKAAAYRRKRREQPDTDAAERRHAEGSPADAAEAREALARVQRCLDALDFEHRATFVLYELEGQSCAEIAEALDIPVGTVYSRLHHARRRLVELHAALAAPTDHEGRAHG